MTTLVVGASGATGRLLVAHLLNRGQKVRAIVRTPEALPEEIKNHPLLSVIHDNVHALSDDDMRLHVKGCDALASCLGHNLSFKGIYGPPRLLVADTTRRLCEAVKANNEGKTVKFVLMNTTGNRNRDLPERVPLSQRAVVGLVRLLLPPHVDNERAADYLRSTIGQSDKAVEWVAVRPDNLTDEGEVSAYTVHPSPTRNAIFDAGQSSRINVGHFMAELISDERLWNQWKGQMPVIYDTAAV